MHAMCPVAARISACISINIITEQTGIWNCIGIVRILVRAPRGRASQADTLPADGLSCDRIQRRRSPISWPRQIPIWWQVATRARGQRLFAPSTKCRWESRLRFVDYRRRQPNWHGGGGHRCRDSPKANAISASAAYRVEDLFPVVDPERAG